MLIAQEFPVAPRVMGGSVMVALVLLQLLATVVLFRCFMLCSEPAIDLDERS